LGEFQNGRYFVSQLSGSARVKVTQRQGGNAVLSGIFAQGEPGPIGPAAPLRISPPKSDSGYYYFNVHGTPGSRFCLDRSSDLRQWTCTETNTFHGSGFMLFPKLGTESGRFFRTHAVP
jgi:hypothetical protein